MIVKKLKLENIRSYSNQVIEFPLGKTLFEGDIGSGKSTILMAVEFGLFGLGSEKPASLLKAGENEGAVSIIFESGGKEYTVQRRLVKKKSSYLQDDCALRSEAGIVHYSASEIKERVLEILDFNEPPDPKAQSVIFRYAIYTPQEEIKNVLALKPDLRLQTLRKAFRLEDYKVAFENVKNLHAEIKLKAREYTNYATEIPEINEKFEQLESWITKKIEQLEILKKKHNESKTRLNTLKIERDELEKAQLALKGDAGRIQDLNSQIESTDNEIKEVKKQIESINSKVAGIEPRINELKTLKNPSEETLDHLQLEIQMERDREKELRRLETKIKAKLEDYDSIMQEEVCPTCDRKIDADSFVEKLEHKREEHRDAYKKVESCAKLIVGLEKTLDLKRRYEQAQSSLKEFERSHGEYIEGLVTNKSKLDSASMKLEESKQQLSRVRESVQKLARIETALQSKKDEIDECDQELNKNSKAMAEGETQIKEWRRQEDEHKESLKKKQEQKLSAEKLNDYLIWIQDYFLPTVEMIEKQVLTSINIEFNSQFQKWFGLLVDDPGKQAKIDEDFTPIIEQDGIDQDVSFLSGGEKTSVALAYRLALNNIVRRVSTGMHSNVLILDEPTDGFSKEQLGRVREILDELDCPQIILVSHERELESFADQIFRVTKTNGVSTISAG